MKKSFKWVMMAIVTLVMGVSFASCSDDDGNSSNPPIEEAKEAYLQAGVYVTESTLKYFDVVVTDIDGNQVNLSANNTTVVTDTVFGHCIKQYKYFFNSDNTCNATDNRLRLWKSDKQTFKNFPVTKQFIVKSTKKADVRPADDEKMYYICISDVDITNDIAKYSYYEVGGSYSMLGGILGSNWDKVPTFEKKSTVTFNAAGDVTGELNK